MEIIKGKEIPPFRRYYDFDSLKHGDAFRFHSFKSATDTFRTWRKERNRPNTRLVRGTKPGEEDLLFFVDGIEPGRGPKPRKTPVRPRPPMRKAVTAPKRSRGEDEI